MEKFKTRKYAAENFLNSIAIGNEIVQFDDQFLRGDDSGGLAGSGNIGAHESGEVRFENVCQDVESSALVRESPDEVDVSGSGKFASDILKDSSSVLRTKSSSEIYESSVNSKKFRFFSLRGLNSFLIDNSEGPLVKGKSAPDSVPPLSKKLSSSHKRNNSSLSVIPQSAISKDASSFGEDKVFINALQNDVFSVKVLANRRLFVSSAKGCTLAAFSVVSNHVYMDSATIATNMRYSVMPQAANLSDERESFKRKRSLNNRSSTFSPGGDTLKTSISNSALQIQELTKPALDNDVTVANTGINTRKSASVSFAPYLVSAGTLRVDATHTKYTVFLSHFEALHRLSGAQPTHNVNSYAHYSTSFHVFNSSVESPIDNELLIREFDYSLPGSAASNFIGNMQPLSSNAGLILPVSGTSNAAGASLSAAAQNILQSASNVPLEPSSFSNPFRIPPKLLLKASSTSRIAESFAVALGRKLQQSQAQDSLFMLHKSFDRRRLMHRTLRNQSSFLLSSATAKQASANEPLLSLDEEGIEVFEYDPNFFDNSNLKTGKHRTVVTLPFFIGSLLPHTHPRVIKRELNEFFCASHPTVDPTLTLSHVRSIKRQLVQIALLEDIELASVAIGIVFFEKLALKGLIGKANRKLIAGICLLLATKVNDSKELNQGKVIKAISKQLDLTTKAVMLNEIAVYAALEFSLYIPTCEILPHLERVVELADLNNLEEYYGYTNFYSLGSA